MGNTRPHIRFTDLAKGALILSVALAWNETAHTVVQNYTPDRNKGYAMAAYAVFVTLMVIVIVTLLNGIIDACGKDHFGGAETHENFMDIAL